MVSPKTISRRVHRLATPPPSYTSVDDLNSAEAQTPPTYEEATRIEIENVIAEEIESEEAKDDVGVTIEIPTSSDEIVTEETTELNTEST